MAVLVDSNVLLDIVTRDPVWLRWSLEQLDRHAPVGALLVNNVICAEISVRLPDVATCHEFLASTGLEWQPMPRGALFLAGRAHSTYRKRGGSRTGVLPDFFTGAHAAVEGWSVLTRDAARYRTYFPTLTLIAP